MASDFASVRGETLRWLLDREPEYRRIALLGSLFAGVLGGLGTLITAVWGHAAARPTYFLLVWIAMGGLGAFATAYLLASAAFKRGEPFVSRGFRLALDSLLPPALAAFAILVLLTRAGIPPALIASIASILYGNWILAASPFAPKPLRRLGWSFLAAGLVLLGLLIVAYLGQITAVVAIPAWIWTASTFCLLHLIYPIYGRGKAG